ncbi:MAG: MBOAT family O-acyltransferase [Caldimonas sp.]
MNYTDPVFFVFFALTFALYYALRNGRLQVALLVLASLFFYAWEAPAILGVFLGSWLITGLSSHAVLVARDARRARWLATLGVAANLGLLGFFKYKFLFLPAAAAAAPHSAQSLGEWLLLAPLPIGISFYTFHGISLLVDVYRGNTAIARDAARSTAHYLTDTLLYLAFFPQLIAGPIIKARDFMPQVTAKRFADIDFAACFRLLVLGFFLKSVIADNLSSQTIWIAYPYFQWRSSIDLWLMLLGYSAQIFADFAGYSLIAIGLARLLGYRLPDNFNFPYVATSIADFWRRWHISLSSWLRDYLYIPLGGSQKGPARTYVNLLIVMLLGGLWHGAAWSFAVWGLWHGAGLALERRWLGSQFMRTSQRGIVGLRMLLVFAFVSIGWLFFKLQEFGQALLYLRAMVVNPASGVSTGMALLVLLYASAVALYHLASLRRTRIPALAKEALYGVMLFLIVTSAGPSTPFIYFQF